MIPKQAIEKAIEGGWKNYIGRIAHTEENLEGWLKYSAEQEWESIALDPSFWQCLGKVLGWNDKTGYFNDFSSGKYNQIGVYAHRFYDLILTGGDTETFWKEILNKEAA